MTVQTNETETVETTESKVTEQATETTEEETSTETEQTTETSEETEGTTETSETSESTENPNDDEQTEEDPAERVVPSPGEYTLPEGVPPSIAEFAHNNDMTQEQLDNTLTEFSKFVTAERNSEQEFMLQEGQKVVDSWGESKNQNLNLLKRALNYYDPEGEVAKALDTTGYGNHPVMLNFLLRMGKDLLEGGFISTTPADPDSRKKSAASVMFGKNHPSKS